MKTCRHYATLPGLALLLVVGAGLLAWSLPGQAMRVTGIASPGQPVLIDLSGQDDDDTGVTVLNQESSAVNEISIELLQNDPILKLPGPEGFVLLDNTLRVSATNPGGKRRIRIRMDYARYERIGLRRLGIRADTIRLLRADLASGRWSRAVRRINEQRIADIAYRRALKPDFILGHHGFDKDNQFAWAVTDTRGDQFFALGGLAVVPLPAAWLLFLSSSGLIWLVSRKRRASASQV